MLKMKLYFGGYHGKEIPVLPVSEFPKIFGLFHEPGHLGARKMIDTILQRYYLYDLSRMVRMAVASCDICLRRGNIGIGKAPFKHSHATEINEKIHIDLIGRFPKRTPEGYWYALTIVDVKTRHLTCVPLTNNTSDNILDKMTSHYFHIYGFPKTIVTDQGHELVSGSFYQFCNKIGIKMISVPAHHPRGNGMIERINKTIKTYLGKLTQGKMFRAVDLSACTFHYNSSVHSSMKETPFFMRFGNDPTLEATLAYNPDFSQTYDNSAATEMIVRNHERRKYAENELQANFDKCDRLRQVTLKNNEYRIGDPVLVRNHKRTFKNEPEFLDGFTIKEKQNDYTNTVQNATTGRKTKLHVEDIKLDISAVRDNEYEDEMEEEVNHGEND